MNKLKHIVLILALCFSAAGFHSCKCKKETTRNNEQNGQHQVEQQYKDAVTKADKLFAAMDYENAKKAYDEALKLKPQESYPKQQITKCDEAMSGQTMDGYTPATVIFYELDGCKWMLLLENGAKLQPQGMLAEAFQKDQMKVWVKYEMQKDAPNICMAGEVVKILDIKERK